MIPNLWLTAVVPRPLISCRPDFDELPPTHLHHGAAQLAGADRFDNTVMRNAFDGDRLHVFGVDDMMLNGDYSGNFP